MYYSEDFIREVIARNDIVDVISEFVALKRSGSVYKCCCPFHPEKTPSFTVNKEKQIFKCFGCGVGGYVTTFVQKHENYSYPEAIEYLAKRAGMNLPEKELTEEEKIRYQRKNSLYDVNKTAAAYFHYLLTKTDRGKNGYEYYKKRGYSDETINGFGLGFADIYKDDLYQYLKSRGYKDELIRDAGLVKFDEKKGPRDMFFNRVMVPIADINGKVIAFGGRVMDDGLPKYLNTRETEIFNKGRNLFAMNIARHSKRKGIILCEGYMDVIAMHQAGFDNAVASLGTAFTEGQAGIIKRYTNVVYLAYDSDGPGTKAALKAISILRNIGLSQKIISLKPYKDPDEFIKNLGVEAFEERVRDAETGRIFEINQIYGNYDMNNPEDKTAFMKTAARLLAGIEDKTERTNYVEAVAMKFFLDKDELKNLVVEFGLAGLKDMGVMEMITDDTIDYRSRRLSEASKKEIKPEEENEIKLLMLMVNNPELFDKLSGIISEKDFTEGIIAEVAEKIFKLKGNGEEILPTSIISVYEDVESQEKVSEIFTKELDFDTTPSMLEKVITDLVIKIKTNNIDKAIIRGDGGSPIELARKKAELRKLKIRL